MAWITLSFETPSLYRHAFGTAPWDRRPYIHYDWQWIFGETENYNQFVSVNSNNPRDARTFSLNKRHTGGQRHTPNLN